LRPYLENTRQKGAGRVVQVTEPLPSKYKALSSNPNYPPHAHTQQKLNRSQKINTMYFSLFFRKHLLSRTNQSQVLVAHACNPRYPGGSDQDICGSKPARRSILRDPILKKSFTKKGWWSGSRCRPQIQTPIHKTKQEQVKPGAGGSRL
jgi:hypothetical protein